MDSGAVYAGVHRLPELAGTEACALGFDDLDFPFHIGCFVGGKGTLGEYVCGLFVWKRRVFQAHKKSIRLVFVAIECRPICKYSVGTVS